MAAELEEDLISVMMCKQLIGVCVWDIRDRYQFGWGPYCRCVMCDGSLSL